MAENITRILNVGSGPMATEWARIVFENLSPLEIIRLDIDPDNEPDIVHDILKDFPEELNEAFDVVFASHVLEHMPLDKVRDVTRRCVKTVPIGGTVAFVVPDVGFAMREILSGRETKVVAMHLWGGQSNDFDYHRCGFTENTLRILMEKSGCETPKINKSRYIIRLDDIDNDATQLFGIAKRRE